MRRILTLLGTLALLATPGVVAAQTFDPLTQSPMELLATPADGVKYYEMRLRAQALVQERKDAEAEKLYEQLAREYPRDGMNWIRLAGVQERLGKYSAAAEAYERAGPIIGWGIWYIPRINAARMRLAAGDTFAALAHLRTEIDQEHSLLRNWLWEQNGFASLRENKEFQRLSGHVDASGLSRDEGWRRDIDFLHDEIRRTNPDYRGLPMPAEFTRRYEQLKQDIPRLSNEEIFVRMNRMLAPLAAGHTGLFNPPGGRHLPIQVYAFPEGVFIIDAADSSLVGTRVMRVGSMSTDSILRALSLGRSTDGDMQHLWGTNDLVSTTNLKGIGAIPRVDSVTLTVQRPGGAARTITVATDAKEPALRQDKLVAPRGVKAPLFLRDLVQKHWETALPEHDALYVQYNNVSNDQDESMAAFGRRLWTVVDSSKPGNLIIDLRHNNGGSTSLYPELLRTVIAFSRVPGNQVYALIGRRTFSATANFITDLERLANPVWVGEASSECCSFHGDPSHIVLPYSKVEAEVTAVRWNLSANVFDKRREMSPDVPVQLTAKAYFAGEDPALEAVFRLIAARRTAKP